MVYGIDYHLDQRTASLVKPQPQQSYASYPWLGPFFRYHLTFTPSEFYHSVYTTAPSNPFIGGSSASYPYRRSALVQLFRTTLQLNATSPTATSPWFVGSAGHNPAVRRLMSHHASLAMTAIFLRRALGVNRTMHRRSYRRSYPYAVPVRGPSPSLLGHVQLHRNQIGWVVAVSRGRSRRHEWTLPFQTASDKSVLPLIAGQFPWVCIGCIAHHQSSPHGTECVVVDPDGDNEDAQDWQVDTDRWAFAYYARIVESIDDGRPVDNGDDEIVRANIFLEDGPLNISLGLHRGIYDLIRRTDKDAPNALGLRIDDILGRLELDSRGPADDGVHIEVS